MFSTECQLQISARISAQLLKLSFHLQKSWYVFFFFFHQKKLPIEAGSQILVTLHHGTSLVYPRVLHLGFADKNCFVLVGFCSSGPKIVVVYNALGWTREEYIRFPLKNLVWLSMSLHFPLATWRQLFVAFNQFFLFVATAKTGAFQYGHANNAPFHFASVKVLMGMMEMGNRSWVLHRRSLTRRVIQSHLSLSLFPSQHVPIAQVVCSCQWCECC